MLALRTKKWYNYFEESKEEIVMSDNSKNVHMLKWPMDNGLCKTKKREEQWGKPENSE